MVLLYDGTQHIERPAVEALGAAPVTPTAPDRAECRQGHREIGMGPPQEPFLRIQRGTRQLLGLDQAAPLECHGGEVAVDNGDLEAFAVRLEHLPGRTQQLVGLVEVADLDQQPGQRATVGGQCRGITERFADGDRAACPGNPGTGVAAGVGQPAEVVADRCDEMGLAR
jgi:hypothetical protein